MRQSYNSLVERQTIYIIYVTRLDKKKWCRSKKIIIKVPAIQKCSTISVFGWKLHIRIALTELIPNITFLFEFDQVFWWKSSKYWEHRKNKKFASVCKNLEFRPFSLTVTFWIWYIRICHRKLSLIMCLWATKSKIPVLKNFDKSRWATSWTTFLANLSPPWFWNFSPIVIRHSNRHLKLNKSMHRFFL